MFVKILRPSVIAARIESKLLQGQRLAVKVTKLLQIDLLVGQNQIGRIFGDIRASHSHRNANRREFQCRGVVDAITSH